MPKLCRQNREKIMDALPGSLIVVASAEEKQRNSDVSYRFRQDSDFLYLTGVTEPGYALVIDARARKSVLVVPDLDEKHQIWLGRQMTAEKARRAYGTEAACHRSEFAALLRKLSVKGRPVHALENAHRLFAHAGLKTPSASAAKALRVALNEARVRKSPGEIELMKTANRISRAGHLAAMAAVRPGVPEYRVQAAMEHEFRRRGAAHNAYPSIVASGANAAILHYHANNRVCARGELLLIDAGCEWRGYASDITRVFPVGGRFTRKQKAIYEIVLKAQKECIAMIRPGVSMLDVHRRACRVMTEGLMKLGILRGGSADELIAAEAHAVFFPHGVGHLLGLDVHDVGARDPKAKPVRKPKTLRASRVLEKNFVVTVEPGLYFIEAHFNSPETRRKTAKYVDWKTARAYREVGGIRIEDDILVTKNGHENLTSVPKEIREIEKIMA